MYLQSNRYSYEVLLQEDVFLTSDSMKFCDLVSYKIMEITFRANMKSLPDGEVSFFQYKRADMI